MGTSVDLASFARKVDKVLDELSNEAMLKQVGMAGKRIGGEEIRADSGGDGKLTNWRRNRPINLAPRFDLKGQNAVEIAPTVRGRGPVRVLNEGRKAGVSRRGRPYGASTGKGTWDRATGEMERELPRVAHEHVTKVLRKHF